MRIQTRTLGMLALAGVAFAAGRLGFISSTVTLASPATPVQDRERSKDRWQAMEEAGEPGKHHAQLNDLVGDWDASFSIFTAPGADPIKVTGTITREWILGGRYLMEAVNGSAEGMGEFEGLGFFGYNNIDGQFEVAWMENTATAIMFETAWIDQKKVMHMSGTRRDPLDGTVIRSWTALDLSSPEHHKFTAWQAGADGVRFKSAEGEAHRRPNSSR